MVILVVNTILDFMSAEPFLLGFFVFLINLL